MNVLSVILFVVVGVILLLLIISFIVRMGNKHNGVKTNTKPQQIFDYLKFIANQSVVEQKPETNKRNRFLEAKRKTFLRGEINGKFRGELDDAMSSATPENFYNATIYEATVNHIKVRKEQEGKFPTDDSLVRKNFDIENPIECYFEADSAKGAHYKLHILDQSFESIELSSIMGEGNTCHGKVDAIIYGYLEDTVKHYATGVSEQKEEGYRQYERHEFESHLGFNYWGPWEFVGYIEGLTGNEQTIYLLNRKISRLEHINKDGETKWGKPTIEKEANTSLLYWIPRILIALLLLVLFIFLVANKMWGGLITLIIILFALYFLIYGNSKFGLLFRWGARILSFLFFAGILFGLINIFRTGIRHSSTKIKRNDYTYRDESLEQTQQNNNQNDSIISHYRVWKDYGNGVHSGFLSLYVSDYRSSFNNHVSFEKSAIKSNSLDFKELYFALSQHDNPGMQLIIQEFEELAKKNNYDTHSKKFAELIVSCIQDIPYALIIPSCNPNGVTDKEIKQLLLKDCPCKESFPDGVQAPLEFMGDLKGDCDTRALFLYSILKRFDFDVILMVSERYKHAIIGINIPQVQGNPVYKSFQGQKYYVWETTAPEMPIGALDPTVDNMNLWNVTLK